MQAPIEVAVEIIEAYTQHSTCVDYRDYVTHANRVACKRAMVEMRPYVDHVLSLLVRSGHLARVKPIPGLLHYAPTDTWSRRDDVLAAIRAPRPVVRAWRIRQSEVRREKRQQARIDRKAQQRQQRLDQKAARLAQQIAERGLTSGGRLRRLTKQRRHTTPVLPRELIQ